MGHKATAWHSRPLGPITARILVIYIMAGKLPPELFFHVRGTHVHHLNYGIFLLSISGAYSLFTRPTGTRLSATAIVYGIGLALAFDGGQSRPHQRGADKARIGQQPEETRVLQQERSIRCDCAQYFDAGRLVAV